MVAGAAMSVLNMREDHFRNGAAELAIGAVIIAHLVHVLGASLLVLSYLAVWHNFGMVKGTSARVRSAIKGGSVHVEPRVRNQGSKVAPSPQHQQDEPRNRGSAGAVSLTNQHSDEHRHH